MDGTPTSDTEFARQLLARLKESEDLKAKRQDDEVTFPVISVAPEPVFGFFMTTGLMQAFKEKVTQHCKNRNRIPVNFQPTHDPETNRSAQEQVEKMIDAAYPIYTADFVYKNDRQKSIAFPRRLGFRMDLCEVFVVPDSDPRVQLRGQKGLRAKTFIPEHTVLGPYRGLLLPRTVTEKTLVRHPRKGWNASSKAWEHEVRRYLVEVQLNVHNSKTGLSEDITLDVCPCAYDSPAALINDPHIFPEDPPLDAFATGERLELSTDRKDEVIAIENATVGSALICGFPFPFAYTTKAMIAGEELLYNYGREHYLLHDHFRAPCL